jgi:cytochrome c553
MYLMAVRRAAGDDARDGQDRPPGAVTSRPVKPCGKYEVAAMSLETNKIAAAVLTAGVIAMTSGFIAGILIHPHKLDHSVYKVEGVEQAAAPAAAAPAAIEPIAPLLAAADVAAGEAQAKKCVACHTFTQGGPNRVGPNLEHRRRQARPCRGLRLFRRDQGASRRLDLRGPEPVPRQPRAMRPAPRWRSRPAQGGRPCRPDRLPADPERQPEAAAVTDPSFPAGALALAGRMADAAGAVIRPHFRTGIAIVDKAGRKPQTIADRDAETAMRRLIEDTFPDHGFSESTAPSAPTPSSSGCSTRSTAPRPSSPAYRCSAP